MKTEAKQYFVIFPMLALLIAGVSMNSFTSGQDVRTQSIIGSSAGDFYHNALANENEN